MAEGRLTGHDDYVTCLAWSPKAPLTLVSGSWVRVYFFHLLVVYGCFHRRIGLHFTILGS